MTTHETDPNEVSRTPLQIIDDAYKAALSINVHIDRVSALLAIAAAKTKAVEASNVSKGLAMVEILIPSLMDRFTRVEPSKKARKK